MALIEESVTKLPPQSLEAEQSVLGAILLDHQSLSKALEILSPDDFYREAHRQIFRGMIEMYERNKAIDLITLPEYLKQQNLLGDVGGVGYLASLVQAAPTAANILYHARIVHEKGVLRGLIHTATDIVTQGFEGTRDADELLDQAEQKIFSISQARQRRSFVPLKDVTTPAFHLINELHSKKSEITGIPSGFIDLDAKTAGFQPSDLIVIAGRPSMGKTSLALGAALHAAMHKEAVVAIFSLEMSKEQLAVRMLSSVGNIDSQKMRTGKLEQKEFDTLLGAMDKLNNEVKIFIDDSGALSALEMRAKARRLKSDAGLDLVIVDYLQLMKGRSNAENRQQEISDISRSLKALAKELNVPVIALSQLSRAVEARKPPRPLLADLRESGAIEQDADLVIFIYREDQYFPDSTDEHGIAEIIIGKQRNGPTGEVKLKFRDEYAKFANLSDR